MASTEGAPVVTTSAQDAASNLHNTDYESTSHHQASSATADPSQASSKAVEMTNLSSRPNAQGIPEPLSSSSTAQNETEDSGEARNLTTEDSIPASSTSKEKVLSPATSKPGLGREYTVPAIGAATDQATPKLEASEIAAATLMITLLLHTGARHPYKIDAKYLKKRNVNVTDNNPINMSVYTLKELIWRDWREEWEPRPASPSSIRLIHYGKLLDDKAHLKDGRFTIGDTPHVVHMTVKPQDVVDDEDAKIAKGNTRDREGNERSPGCRCIIL